MAVQQTVQPALPGPHVMNPLLSAWYRAARPHSLTATYIPLALAGVIALDDGHFNLARFVLALIGALALQIGANLINEYFDYLHGTDAEKQAGMGMVIKNAALTPRMVLYGAIMTVGVGVVIGLLLTILTGPVVLLIGIGGVLVVVLYTAGPLPLSHIGLGEIAVFVFMGPLLVLGAYYVTATQQVSMVAVLAA